MAKENQTKHIKRLQTYADDCLFVFLVDNGNTYQLYVKNIIWDRDSSLQCDTYTHNEVKATKTIIFQCKQPLVGTFLEIVPSLKKPIKVFEIEHFGAFVNVDIIFPIS